MPLFIKGRGVADLLEGRDEAQQHARPLHAVLLSEPLKLLHPVVERRLVECGLLGREIDVAVADHPVGQIRDDRLVGLEAPEHEGSGHQAEGLERTLVPVRLDGLGEGLHEFVLGAEDAGLHDRQERPVLHQPVLHGRPAHGDHLSGGEVTNRLRDAGARVLDGLRLVEHHQPPSLGPKDRRIALEGAVGRDRHVGPLLDGRKLPGRAVVDGCSEAGREALDLTHPVCHQGGGHDRDRLFLRKLASLLHG